MVPPDPRHSRRSQAGNPLNRPVQICPAGSLVRYGDSALGVTVDLATGVGHGGDAEGDRLSGVEWIEGTAYDDRIVGSDADEILDGGAGADVLDGGAGSDRAIFHGSVSDYRIAVSGGVANVTSLAEGLADSVTNIEQLVFDDSVVDFASGAIAVTDVVTATEGADVVIPIASLIANDYDLSGFALSFAGLGTASHGQARVEGETIVFTPDADFFGEAGFGYTIANALGGTATGQVRVDVRNVNDAPVATADGGRTVEDTPLVLDAAALLANDRDLDGDALAVTGVGGAVGGTASLGDDGRVTFTPDGDFNGTARFEYTVSDGHGGSATGTATIDVTPMNDAPVAGLDHVNAVEDQVLIFDYATLLGNDSDPEGDAITLIGTSQAYQFIEHVEGGEVQIYADGIAFTPDPEFSGIARFTYTVADSNDAQSTGEVEIAVAASNDAPVAAADRLTADEDTPLIVDNALLANDTDIDGDILSIIGVANIAHGQVWRDTDGHVVFAPEANFHGTAGFDYWVADGDGAWSTAHATVEVASVNDAPIAQGEHFPMERNTTLTLDPAQLLGNDGDADGDALAIASVGNAVNGTATLGTDGIVAFVPDEGFTGEAHFDYTVSDGHGGEALATAVVTVTDVNHAPVAAPDTLATDEDVPLIVDVPLLANDSDGDGDALSIIGATNVIHGQVARQADGHLVFTPEANFHGTAGFDYTIGDGRGGWSTAQATIEVAPVNDLPTGARTAFATPEDTALTLNLMQGVSDADGDPMTLTVDETTAGGGTLARNPDGTLTYRSAPDFNGEDSFSYTLDDGHGGTVTTAATIDVAPVNDEPHVQGEAFAIDEDDQLITTAAALLANDADVEGGTLSVTAVGNASHGSVALAPDGQVIFTPEANFHGTAGFDYTVSDGTGGTATAAVNVASINTKIIGTQNLPSISGMTEGGFAVAWQSYDMNGFNVYTRRFDASGVAIDVEELVNVTAAGHQFLPAVMARPDESIVSVWYGQGPDGNLGNFGRIFSPHTNYSPIGQADSLTTVEDHPLTIQSESFLANDGDPDGESLTRTEITNVRHGAAVVNSDGTITFTPASDFNGEAGFDYTIADPRGATATAHVTVTVTPVNDLPVAGTDTYTVTEDSSLDIANIRLCFQTSHTNMHAISTIAM